MLDPSTLNQPWMKNADYTKIPLSDLSDMYRHYAEVKNKYPHAILLYRVGDFFETFFQDAITVSQELELSLTSKQAGKIGRVPMTGVPHHAIERYAAMLIEKGFAVAVCDQVEDSADAAAERRIVERQITRLITPGTLLEDEMLQGKKNNYLVAVVVSSNFWGLAYADISTGEFLTTQGEDLELLTQELMRIQPKEVLVPTDAVDFNKLLRPGESDECLPDCLPLCFCYAMRPQMFFTLNEAKSRLLERFKVKSLEGFGCQNLNLAIRAAGGLLQYLEDTFKATKKMENSPNLATLGLQRLRTYTITDYLILDNQTRRNLEITQTIRDGSYQGSLLWAIDYTTTNMGSRVLRRWVLQPLKEANKIKARSETIAELKEEVLLRQEIQGLLKQIYDLERLAGRAAAGTAHAKDLMSLADSLLRLNPLANLVKVGKSPFLKALNPQKIPPELEQLGYEIKHYIQENPPLHVKEGNLINEGVDAELDNRRKLASDDENWMANLESVERERTGIPNLKVGYNKTFGYYIGITKSKSDQVPREYIRKQTLVNEERYSTSELNDRQFRILNARDEIKRMEYEIFVQLRDRVGICAGLIRDVSRSIAALDVLCGLAELATKLDYVRPEIINGRRIEIINGRHPVVESSIPSGFFVPNSTILGQDNDSTPDLIILTGPNASGKSCYLRQVGLIQILAQIGSFIPAKSAKLSICDRIFTRVGAVDDLATGQSTFMVEMNETANILNHATCSSLVLLDEIGRGTATFDGLSIAWAVAEHIATEIRCRTIFATHYHELNELASILSNVANYQVTVKEFPDKIIFLHQVTQGGADRSYGIEAGRLAGLPPSVIQRAREVMSQIEKHSKIALGLRQIDQSDAR